MKELVEVVAKALVDNPDEVVVTEKTEGKNIVLELHVAASDMGKVIGKQGRIAKAIRSVVKAASSKDNTRVDVEIVLIQVRRSQTLSGETYRCVFLRFGYQPEWSKTIWKICYRSALSLPPMG